MPSYLAVGSTRNSNLYLSLEENSNMPALIIYYHINIILNHIKYHIKSYSKTYDKIAKIIYFAHESGPISRGEKCCLTHMT